MKDPTMQQACHACTNTSSDFLRHFEGIYISFYICLVVRTSGIDSLRFQTHGVCTTVWNGKYLCKDTQWGNCGRSKRYFGSSFFAESDNMHFPILSISSVLEVSEVSEVCLLGGFIQYAIPLQVLL